MSVGRAVTYPAVPTALTQAISILYNTISASTKTRSPGPYRSAAFKGFRTRRLILGGPLDRFNPDKLYSHRDISQNRRFVCETFTRRNYVRGIDQLVEFGFVDSDDLSTIIDEFAGNPTSVTATVRLIELKHRHFSVSALDFAL